MFNTGAPWIVLAICALAACGRSAVAQESPAVEIQPDENGYLIHCGEEVFARFDFRSQGKPILYPLYAPGQIAITRNYPMKPGVPGEADDHPHHKSVWFAHGDTNGVDFWTERGQWELVSSEHLGGDDSRPAIASLFSLRNGEKPVGRLGWKMFFECSADTRLVDFEFALQASDGPMRLGDTKEGTFAIRTHPQLRLTNDPARGVVSANGSCVNSEGVSGKSIWGKNARWVYYYGRVDDAPVGVAIIDHPSNLRHPTTWHARDYGLIAANPFGLHDFQGAAEGSGQYVIADGDQLVLRYRLVLLGGAQDPARVEKLAEQFAQAP